MWISEKLPASWFVAMCGLKVFLLTSIPIKWLQKYANMLHRIISGKETALVLITTRRSDWILHQMFTNLEKMRRYALSYQQVPELQRGDAWGRLLGILQLADCNTTAGRYHAAYCVGFM